MNLKRIKQIIHEGNFASSGMVRGLGAVTGEANANGEPGTNQGWIAQTSAGQQAQTQATQGLIDYHNDLHDEIEGNDLNPKDGNKKVKVVISQA